MSTVHVLLPPHFLSTRSGRNMTRPVIENRSVAEKQNKNSQITIDISKTPCVFGLYLCNCFSPWSLCTSLDPIDCCRLSVVKKKIERRVKLVSVALKSKKFVLSMYCCIVCPSVCPSVCCCYERNSALPIIVASSVVVTVATVVVL